MPVPWQHCSPSRAQLGLWQQELSVRDQGFAHLRLMNSRRERLSMCWDLGLSWLSMSCFFLQSLSFPLTTWDTAEAVSAHITPRPPLPSPFSPKPWHTAAHDVPALAIPVRVQGCSLPIPPAFQWG